MYGVYVGMWRFLVIVVGLLLPFGALTKQLDTCAQHHDVCSFVVDLKGKVYSAVEANTNTQESLEELVDGALDLGDMAKFVMGSHWKEADLPQKERFTSTYGRYVKSIYVRQLHRYAFYQMRIISVRPVNSETYAVRVRLINRKQRNDFVVLEFYIISNGGLKVGDIRINNSISIAVNQRALVDGIIKESGIEGAISHFESENSRMPRI